jgi:hypothetical protein
MPAERRQPPENESEAFIEERAADALMKRRAALVAADWAARVGATVEDVAEMLEALGIDKHDLAQPPTPTVITLR